MHRKRITATAQLRAERLLKRAIKRGDAPPPDPLAKKTKPPKKRIRAQGANSLASQDAIEALRKLQSAFIKLPPSFLEDTNRLASTLPLSRPIPMGAAVLSSGQADGESVDHALIGRLTCPERPKWRFDMTKLELQENEEGSFKKWIGETDQIVEEWKVGSKGEEMGGDDIKKEANPAATEPEQMPKSSTFYERNLEVWRQLWRVVEISQIILVLLDSRCPLLHFPPSLAAYLSERRVILVLTKVDLSGPARAAAWTRYLHEHYPGRRIVQVEAYTEKVASDMHQGRAQWEPHLQQSFKERLVKAIREVHAEVMVPPETIGNDAEKVAQWKSPVKQEIDWERVVNGGGEQMDTAADGAAVPKSKELDSEAGGTKAARDVEPEFLTIGLIGKFLKVSASKTPGKTKHFQTLFWTPDVRLVDCPGLVMPNLVPMEMQVLSGILPISRVSAISACIYYICQHLPLEQIFKLEHPSLAEPPVEDKRTWRDGKRPASVTVMKVPKWTAMDVLMAYAEQKGWVTAQAGRPDVGRAGNARVISIGADGMAGTVLRAVTESRVRWAFWPPGTDEVTVKSEADAGDGIWIAHAAEDEVDIETESDEEEESSEATEEHSDSDLVEQDEGEDAPSVSVGMGRFGALVLGQDEREESDDKENE
ncbi:hypothetical protein HWV62_21232 [Athelia sp. TMB]|nr:hypothetical protein HWV62_21232 [Athelia sp. TMB]